MRNDRIAIIAILASFILPSMFRVYAAPQTMEGVISDSMCGKKHMMPGKPDQSCIRECVKAGSTYALVVGDKTYTLVGTATAIAPFAGKYVQVQGNVKQSSIDVASIHEAVNRQRIATK